MKFFPILLAIFSLTLHASPRSKPLVLKSPQGALTFTLAVENGVPVYAINHGSSAVILPSRLGLAPTFTEAFHAIATSESHHTEDWRPLYGERNSMPDRYNELLVTLETASQKKLRLEVRAFDEGVAFRYGVAEPTTVDAEKTEFHLPAGSFAYQEHGGTEGVYDRSPIDDIAPLCQIPLTIDLPDGTNAAILEAASVDSPLVTLGAEHGVPNTLVTGLGGAGRLTANQFTPWRLIMWAATPGKLLEHNYLELDLNRPSELGNAAWIKPGTAMRELSLSDEGAHDVIDFAAAHHIDYLLFDDGWYGREDEQLGDATHERTTDRAGKPVPPLHIQKIVEYGRARGVGVFLYLDRRQAIKQRDILFPLYEKWGIAGVKLGFVQVGAQADTAWIFDTVREAAKHHLMLDIHDQYRTTGYTRTYPNLLTVEGVRGNEHFPTAEHNATLPFTRLLSGSADYTICYYAQRLENSHAHQLAMSIIIYSPLQSIFWYDDPSRYHNEPEIRWFHSLPTVWDETRVPLGQIGKYVVEARRSGSSWYVGAISDSQGHDLALPLTFLKQGVTFDAAIYTDDPHVETATHVAVTHRNVTSRDVLQLKLAPRGGEAIFLKPIPDDVDSSR